MALCSLGGGRSKEIRTPHQLVEEAKQLKGAQHGEKMGIWADAALPGTEEPTPPLQSPPKDLIKTASLGAPWTLHAHPLLSLLEPGLWVSYSLTWLARLGAGGCRAAHRVTALAGDLADTPSPHPQCPARNLGLRGKQPPTWPEAAVLHLGRMQRVLLAHPIFSLP